MSSVAKGSQQEPGTWTPWHTEWMEEVSFSRVLFLINEWLWKFASATDLIMTCHEFNLKPQGKRAYKQRYTAVKSCRHTSNPPHTTMSCQPPCCQQLKPEARFPFQHECIFLNSNYRSKRDFWQMSMEVQRIFPYFKNPFDCHWGVSSKFQLNVAHLHAQGELSWEFVKF